MNSKYLQKINLTVCEDLRGKLDFTNSQLKKRKTS